ncbi:hypothetical protein Aph01nite_76990 [Acrocarpospora phusangensis]|uniref:Spore-associated protein A n=2 Tax=Acrocarpospora phusangensis TaxID=1070424 RepID=A0A919UQ27_9ACTN|nr:hypothetical protein Aph01nite_76990 [Acrocarpospora phusangensis]
MAVLAVIAMTLGLTTGPVSATALAGRIGNGTSWAFTATIFNEGVDDADCTVWNSVNGGPARSLYLFTVCDQRNIGAGTTTGLTLDLDAFRPSTSYPPAYYLVRWGSSDPWKVVDWYHYTRIKTDEKANCVNGSVYIECTIGYWLP